MSTSYLFGLYDTKRFRVEILFLFLQTTLRLATRIALRPIRFKSRVSFSKNISPVLTRFPIHNNAFIRYACNSGSKGGKKLKQDCCGDSSKGKITKKPTSECGGKNNGKGDKARGKEVLACSGNKQEEVETEDNPCGEKKMPCSDDQKKFKKEIEEKEEAANECSESEEETSSSSSSESDESKDDCTEKDEKETEEKECSEAEESEENQEDKTAKDEKAVSNLCECTTAALAKGVDKGKEAMMQKISGKKSQGIPGPCQTSNKGASEKPKVSDKVRCCQVETASTKPAGKESSKSNLAKCKERMKESNKTKGEDMGSSEKKYSTPEEFKKTEEQCNCIRQALEKCNGSGTNIPGIPSKPPDKKGDKPGDKEKPVKPDKTDPKQNENGKDKEKGKGNGKKPTGPRVCNATRVGRKQRPVTKVCK